MSNLKAPITFNNHILETVTRLNQVWFTAKALAIALEYSRGDKITAIYNRNKHEFEQGMTETLKLGLSGNYLKTVRIFSLRGAHLIAMFARTPVAEQFRKWVLDLIDKETTVKQSSTIIAPNREILPKGIYHAQSKYNPYRATAWNAELKKMVMVGVFPTVQAAVNAQENYLKTGEIKRIQKYSHRKLPEIIRVEETAKPPCADASDRLNHAHLFLEAAQLLYLYPNGKALFWDLITFTQNLARQDS